MKKFKNIFIYILLLLSILILPSCTVNKNPNSYRDPSTFDEFAAEIFYLVLSGDELSSNYLFEDPAAFGLERYEPVLPTPSTGNIIGTSLLNLYFQPLYYYKYEELSFDQQMTYLVIDNLITKVNETNGMSYLSADYLGSYLGYQAQLPILLVEYTLKDEIDVNNYLKYLEQVPDTFKAYVDFEIEKADNGYGMPNFVIDKVIDQCDSFIKEVNNVMNTHFMIEMFNNKIDNCSFLDDAKKEDYKIKNEELVKGALCDGYAYVRNNLNVVYDKATNNMGLAHYVTPEGVEIGKQYYAAIFKDATGYDMPVDEAITYLQGKLDSKLLEYRNIYANNPNVLEEVNGIQLMDCSPEEQLAFYEEIIYNYFPSLDLEVMPETTIRYVDESLEDHFSPAAYMVSAVDNYTSEFIYLNNKSIHTVDSDGNKVLDYNYLYTTLAHEGFPGHMYQNIYFKNTDANLLRKVLKNSGYMEGWATYTELYSYNFVSNLYSSDALRFLRLNDEVNGLIQTRLDMGIHWEGWTKEEAESYLGQYISSYNKESASYVPGAIDKVYEQLVEVPTNSQKYFFTYLKIEDMYNFAVENSEEFDPVEFHKIILDCGPVPLRYIEEIVKEHYSK